MKRHLVLFFSLICISSVGAEPSWKQTLESEYKWSKITTIGTLLVSTDKSLLNINPTDGNIIWQRDDLTELSPFNVSAIAGMPLLMVNKHEGVAPPKTRLQLISIETGKSLWDTGIFAATNLTAIPIPSHNLVLYAADHSGSTPWGKNGTNLKQGSYVSALKLDTGEVVYNTLYDDLKNAIRHPSDNSGGWIPDMDLAGHPSPVIEGDIIYLPFTGVTAINIVSGKIIWNTTFKTANQSLKFTNASPIISNNNIYTSGFGYIYAINKTTGEIIWKSKVGKGYHIPELLITDKLIIGRIGGSFSNGKDIVQAKPFGVIALKRETGKKNWLWKKGEDGMTNMAIVPERNWVMVADRTTLYALDLTAKKKAKVVKKVTLEFKRDLGTAEIAAKGATAVSGFLSGGLFGGIQGGLKAFDSSGQEDPPTNISMVDGDLIVRGQYHLLSYDNDSQDIEYSIAFQPPGMNGLALAAMGAITVVSTVANTGLHNSWSTRNMALDNSLNVSGAFSDAVSERYAKSAQSENLAFFLTTKEEGLQLMGINLKDGTEVGSVPMDEKEPKFMVDDVANIIYYIREGKEVLAYPF